jgi:hypothetical protein
MSLIYGPTFNTRVFWEDVVRVAYLPIWVYRLTPSYRYLQLTTM